MYQASAPAFQSDFSNTSNVSISGWFKSNGQGTLFSNTEGAFAKGLRANLISNGVQISFKNASGIAFLTTTAGAVNDGLWHHIVVVLEPGHSTKKQRMYLDGVEVASHNASLTSDSIAGSNGFTLLGDGTNNAHVPSPSVTDGSKLDADISNWSIHSEALDVYAIAQLYLSLIHI